MTMGAYLVYLMKHYSRLFDAPKSTKTKMYPLMPHLGMENGRTP